MKIKLYIVSFFLFSVTLISKAQEGNLGLQFMVGVPQGEFSEVTDAIGMGGNLNFIYYPGDDFPLGIGAQLGGMVYGSNTQREDLVAQIKFNDVVIDELVIPLEIVTTNSIVNFDAIMRLRAPLKLVSPYIEGLVGFNYISTYTKIIDKSEDHRFSSEDDNVIVKKTQLEDYIFVYGFGGGLAFSLGKSVWIDLRVDYLLGGKADYYDGDDTKKWEIDFIGASEADYHNNNVNGDDLNIQASPKRSRT
ncbi:hypothetical protein ACFLRZ_04435, partial [Bacteroidota bacterium]